MRSLQFKALLLAAALACATACSQERAADTSGNAAAAAPATQAATPPSPKKDLDVPYVPTHQTIVDEMLAMAEVTGSDVLYDLGSGDGRIPITAAKKFGTRGVGIDLNPVRIREANEKAQEAGVTDKVRFIEGDLFQQDFSGATVVTLYLLPDVNIKLRPKILAMKPGTRVVSHNYNMGDWEPEKMKTMRTPDGVEHYIYFWRVPEKQRATK